jgi:hypothetical protein
LESYPALVLNADFRPLSYFPLSLWSWQDAVKAVVSDRVNVVSEYDRIVHSPSWRMRLPSVISLKEYVAASRRPAFTRFNVFLRLSIAGNIVCVCLQWLADTMYRLTASPYIAKPADTLPMKEVP